MTEEDLSLALFQAALHDPTITVLSWQAVDGKTYFTADVILRLPNDERVAPDLVILVCNRSVWLIEVKDSHRKALDDEAKLQRLVTELGTTEILSQISRRAVAHIQDCELRLAVAFDEDLPSRDGACVPSVVHISWGYIREEVERSGLAAALTRLVLSA
ncbi:MAG: hypothetical protein M0005_09275 [Actinomycetota bacterium]|nr:hypothetical protein [Actinomycetota bacterium]MDA8355344.1 hypothetical protein [Actinomycetota bacterium]